MAGTQDCSIGFATESTFKTYATPTRWPTFTEESLEWTPNTVQGEGLVVGGRVARSSRRVRPSAQGAGGWTMEAQSKGMGVLWRALMGTGVSTLVSGSTYQQNFTLGDTPDGLTIQKGVVQVDGTVQPLSFLGCMSTGFEIEFTNQGLVMVKPEFDAADFTTAQAYAAPSGQEVGSLFHFANLSIASGTLTAPTTTALASGTTTLANLRNLTVKVERGYRDDRFNAGGSGRKAKGTYGLTGITGTMEVELDSNTLRDAFLNDTPLVLIATCTAEALSTGNATLQVTLPEIKLDGVLPKVNGPDLITVPMAFTALDNDVAAQPMWISHRTSDTAL